ncbi:D-alanine--D-alanine ligase family protein [Patescibacteria group bacterium]
MKKIKVGVIFGGQSGEHEVSVVSARAIIDNLDKTKYDVIPLAVLPNGLWLNNNESNKYLLSADVSKIKKLSSKTKQSNTLVPLTDYDNRPFDVIFPIIHGTSGEDGKIQGLFELAKIPFVGSEVIGSAVGMDKIIQKQLFDQAGIPVVEYQQILLPQWKKTRRTVIKNINTRLKYPVFVKPANQGSSVGINKVNNKASLVKAINIGFKFDHKVIVEEAVANAREFECAILGNENPIASTVGEVIPGNEFYDYDAKYVDENSLTIVPAKIPKKLIKIIRHISIKAFMTINAIGMARVDFLYNKKTRKLFLNEINTVPGFVSISMYPKLWQASGISYARLLDKLIKLAIQRHNSKTKLSTKYKTNNWYKKT